MTDTTNANPVPNSEASDAQELLDLARIIIRNGGHIDRKGITIRRTEDDRRLRGDL